MSNDSQIAAPLRLPAVKCSWIDEHTGRLVQQMTDVPEGAALSYFRLFRHLPDGRMLVDNNRPEARMLVDIHRGEPGGAMLALDPQTGAMERLRYPIRHFKMSKSDGRIWGLKREGHELWTAMPPTGEPELVASLPVDVFSQLFDITCDGSTLILQDRVVEKTPTPVGATDVEAMWTHFRRKRSGSLYAYDIASGTRRNLLDTQGACTFHVETSPTDPTLVRYAEDVLECAGQRMFTVRTDGSDQQPIRVQQYGEMITHEFWWADPNFIGYTYQDRRNDTTIEQLPWSEYAPVPTHLGIADLQGKEVFLSDPLNSYHSHLYVSRRGDLITGEGTDGNSFVFAAPFSWSSTKIDFTALATIHTPYSAMAGQGVNADFSADGKWLLYNDTIDGVYQVCRVKIDF